MGDAFTYEDIYELYRNERFSTDLQELTPGDLKKIKNYFEEKNKETKNQDQSLNLFSTHNRAKIQVELSNATRVVKDLLERRERKVISRAVFNSRSEDSLRDTSNMLKIEEELYDQLTVLLKRFRKGFLATIDNDGNYPIEQMQPLKIEEKSEPKIADVPKTYYALETIPEFFGPDTNKFGPFNQGDVVNAPEEIINILLPQNKIGLEKPEHQDASEPISPIEEFKNEVLTDDIDSQNEISKTNTDVLSFETVQETHTAQDQTFEEQSSAENKKERSE